MFTLLLLAAWFPPPDIAAGWRTAEPANVGMDRKTLDHAFDYIQGSTRHGGLLVVRHGWLVYERYFGRASREAAPNTASCGKTFTSVAMGILMAERPELFPNGLDQEVYTPRYLPPEAFPLNDPRKARIKLGQLLSMSAGLRGNSPGYVRGKEVPIEPPGLDGWPAMVDTNAFRSSMWCDPGAGYSYATVGPQIVSAIIRHIAGMELESYVRSRIAEPLGWGPFSYGYRRPEITHTPGGGGIAPRATDMLRFAYLLLHQGNWNGRQVVPAAYVRQCGRPSPYNPHYPYSLQTELNSEGAAPQGPRDAYWKQGSGGHAVYVVPSLDMVVWKIGGRDEQYPATAAYDGSRRNWRRTVSERAAALHTLELVAAAVRAR